MLQAGCTCLLLLLFRVTARTSDDFFSLILSQISQVGGWVGGVGAVLLSTHQLGQGFAWSWGRTASGITRGLSSAVSQRRSVVQMRSGSQCSVPVWLQNGDFVSGLNIS